MPPAITFAEPDERLALVDPVKLVPLDVNPGPVSFNHHGADAATAGASQEDVILILLPVQLLHKDLTGIVSPVHARQVMIARIAQNVEPARAAARGADDADTRRRIGLADL